MARAAKVASGRIGSDPYNKDEWFLAVLCVGLMLSGPLGYFAVTIAYPLLRRLLFSW